MIHPEAEIHVFSLLSQVKGKSFSSSPWPALPKEPKSPAMAALQLRELSQHLSVTPMTL